jgi:hypothetical protein
MCVPDGLDRDERVQTSREQLSSGTARFSRYREKRGA